MAFPATAIVIAGASGDLAKRKLVPALDVLFQQGKLAAVPLVVGTGRTAFTDEQFRGRFTVSAPFARRLFYHRRMRGLRRFIDAHGKFERVVFFLSLPPSAYVETAREISAEGFGKEAAVIIEKPFGFDAASARKLNSELVRYFDESQIFRIDHYLAKEAVQNMLVFRFANSLFYPVWNSHYVESIQISALEEGGIVERGAYFDRAGIIRDMVQNHLLQLLCLLTMEAPLTLRSDDICCRKIDVLRALRIETCHRFQYAGYRSEQGVDPA
ncbi:MAG: hypothetical protein JXA18_13535, partial [Chitinispirillaceae bacterium]|nr:hypothetical protein [Chitinispirillaceae bacterium]